MRRNALRLLTPYALRGLADWPHSTFHRLVERGVYPADWAGGDEDMPGYKD